MLHPVENFDVIEDFNDSTNEMLGKRSQFIVGCFEEKEGNGSAFILMNVEELDDSAYGTTVASYSKIKIKGENVTFCKEGEPIEVEQDENEYYKVRIPNGECLFVTVD